MKKSIGLVLGLLMVLPIGASALTCPDGQMVESVLVTPGSPEIPAIAAWTEYVFVGSFHGDYIKIGPNYIQVSHNLGNYDKVVHAAIPAVPAVEPVYADQCVVDPNYIPPVETPTCGEDQHLEENVCVDNPVAPEPTPAPVVKATVSTPPGSSIFRKLCNIKEMFGVGVCPVADPMKGNEYQDLYAKLIAELKAKFE